MKKLLAIVLVLTLVLSMGVGAFAEDYTDSSEVIIDKNVIRNIKYHEGEVPVYAINPEEIFGFTVGVGSYEGSVSGVEAPGIGDFTITVAQGEASGTANITLPNFAQVGVYTYPITEITGDTAGFVYDTVSKDLKITVINNPDFGEIENAPRFLRVLTVTGGTEENPIKVDAIENEFSAGDLVISKEITGNYAVFTDKFDVTVILESENDIKTGPIAVSGAVDDVGNVSKNEETGVVTVTFKVTHESEVTIANIPYGVSYKVVEDAKAVGTTREYKATITGDLGTMGEGEHLVEIMNELNTEIETGINLDNLPYILILVGVAFGLVAFTLKRRVKNER